jgi:hypothetical protein
VVGLSDRDADPEVLFDLEEAGGLAGLVADLLEHRVVVVHDDVVGP